MRTAGRRLCHVLASGRADPPLRIPDAFRVNIHFDLSRMLRSFGLVTDGHFAPRTRGWDWSIGRIDPSAWTHDSV